MKKSWFTGLALAAMLAAAPSYAENVDSSMWLSGDYIGVGAIDMPKLAKRPIYSYLINFFMTDKAAKKALEEMEASGIVMKEMLSRIVVGLPDDVEKSEHILLWELTVDPAQYGSILASHPDWLDMRTHEGMDYYATRRENECIAILGNVVALGSELRVKEVMSAHKAGYKDGPKSPALRAEIKAIDKKKDAWFAFVLTDKEKKALAKTDPIIDMTAGGFGTLKMSEINKGRLVIDFAKGLDAHVVIGLAAAETATKDARLLDAALAAAKVDPDIKEMGVVGFLNGIAFSAKKSDLNIAVVYDQDRFDELIAFVTQVMKNLSNTKS